MHRFYVAAIATGVLCLLVMGFVSRERFLTGRNDFAQLYAGAQLAGGPDLYSRDANRRVIAENLGVTLQGVLYSRLPFYALLLKPLTSFQYKTAQMVFFAINLVSLIAFAVVSARVRPELPLFVALSVPGIMSLFAGQDTAILLALATAGYLLIRAGREFTAGLILSLCAIKFHLFVVPWAVVAYFRRRAGLGIFAGGLVLVTLSFAAGGWSWPLDYRARVSSDELHPGAEHMPTFRAVTAALGTPDVPTAAVGALLVIGLLVLYIRRTQNFELGFALSIVAGLLLGWHAYLQDAVLLLLPLVIFMKWSGDEFTRGILALSVLPPLWFVLLGGSPWSALVPGVLLGILVLAAARWREAPQRDS